MHIHPSLERIRRIQQLAKRRELFAPDELRDLTVEIARQAELWGPLIRHTTEARWFEALVLSDALELWLIGWAPGQATPTHDHGGAAGALTVAAGDLVETVHADSRLTRPRRITRSQGAQAHFSPHHIHRVANEGAVNATSIHAYSPAGLEMRIYDGRGERLLVAAGSGGDAGV
jgi:predicted metal-dependent enzyme (double-stranded beta helix superfamily)